MRKAASASEAAVPEPSFEEAVLRLETIVANLESGTLTLEESLAQFEQAVGLSRQCSARLAAAEKRIQVLTEDGIRPLDGPLGEAIGGSIRGTAAGDDDPFEDADGDGV